MRRKSYMVRDVHISAQIQQKSDHGCVSLLASQHEGSPTALHLGKRPIVFRSASSYGVVLRRLDGPSSVRMECVTAEQALSTKCEK